MFNKLFLILIVGLISVSVFSQGYQMVVQDTETIGILSRLTGVPPLVIESYQMSVSDSGTHYLLRNFENGGGLYWGLTGNSGGTGSVLGTTNNQDLFFLSHDTIMGVLNDSRDNTLRFPNLGFGWNAFNNYSAASLKNSFGNVWLGGLCLAKNDTGAFNVGIGWNSCVDNVSGNSNISVGTMCANCYVRNSNNNIAIGSSALTNATTTVNNNNNICIGYRSLTNISSNENDLISIGSNNTVSAGDTNSIVLGNGVNITASNQLNFAGKNITTFVLPGITGSMPVNTVTPVLWEKVVISGSNYYIPLYQ